MLGQLIEKITNLVANVMILLVVGFAFFAVLMAVIRFS